MSVRWQSFGSAESAAQAASKHILAALGSALSRKEEAAIAVSGGSTPKLLFRHMAGARFDWSRVHIFWVDERPVPPDDAQSNYRLAREHLLTPARIPPENLHRILGELEPAVAAQRYADDLREHFQVAEGEVPVFDVIHLGAGSDSHTASLFPGEPLIEDRKGLAAAVFVEKIPQWRITLLPAVLLAAEEVVFLTAGEDKADAVHRVFNEPQSPLECPAQAVSQAARKVVWFLDHAAARQIA